MANGELEKPVDRAAGARTRNWGFRGKGGYLARG